MGLPLAIYLLKVFLDAPPDELFDAARLDGCGDLRMFTALILPLLKPGLATVAIFSALNAWNEFLLAPLYISDDALKTPPIGLLAFSDRYTTDYQLLFSALSIITLPMVAVYVPFHRQIVAGVTEGAVPGRLSPADGHAVRRSTSMSSWPRAIPSRCHRSMAATPTRHRVQTFVMRWVWLVVDDDITRNDLVGMDCRHRRSLSSRVPQQCQRTRRHVPSTLARSTW